MIEATRILTYEELKHLQAVELEMLIELDRICRKYDIAYQLDGGTLLGAVRHQGFIPWDDDIDVIMTRKEYCKFRRACKGNLDRKRFFLQDYKSDPEYRWGYAKLRREGTVFVRKGQEHIKSHDGIFLDIFVVDNVPDGIITKRLHFLICYLIQKGLYSTVGIKNSRNAGEKLLYSILSKIPRDEYFHLRNRLVKFCNRKETMLVSHYTYRYPQSCFFGMPAKCFKRRALYTFEGHSFYSFEDYDTYLSLLYGDYMKLPPKELQRPHIEISRLSFGDV